MRKKITSSMSDHTHWMDNARGAYSETEIIETKMALNAISVFVTFPVFWALYEQQVNN